MPRSFIGPKNFGQVKLTLDSVSERIDIFSKIEEKKIIKYLRKKLTLLSMGYIIEGKPSDFLKQMSRLVKSFCLVPTSSNEFITYFYES